ncbi:MAG: 2-dehydro-3-deoxyglucarate aldolase [Candidatus Magasanikbacteria bacterium GW2011_GWA2_37_8]|uniref:2-dehydro-3-deoxyglucarate aldolase n=1 Tax=Candidatus Magasanikbacteria bacterium GW2011_GWA2_37_8 TaxID=1619036 RepID=A0A0G0HEQ4_9BACT|nr:MAG: 2-dehydro-3-deoxyglucarate aldolase [Candidatus Magasanikbacteria bacterium GW2011_GWA2_37_8]
MNKKLISLKDKLKNGEFTIGTWCIIPSEHVVNILAKAGLDFVLIDMEHGTANLECVYKMVLAANAEGVDALVRVSSNDESEILKVLDVGAAGVIIPHIETVNDCKQALSFTKFPPMGQRGYSPYVRAGGYAVQPDFISSENDKILTGIIIESLEGIKNLDLILEEKELDIVYIGVYDISVGLGIAGDVKNEKIINILTDCTQKIVASGKIAAGLFNTEEDMKFFKQIGINFACYGVDTSVLYKNFNEMVSKV